MEIIAFERGIRCNPPSSFPFESRRRPTEVRGLIYFQSGSTPRFIETHGFPRWRWCCQKPAVEYVLVARKRLPPPLHPSPPNQRGPIFFRQYWPSLYSGRRRGGGGRGPKNSCGFHVARRRNNVDTGRVANPGCSTRRLDYTADLSEALSALSPRTRRPHEIEIYIPAAYPKGGGGGGKRFFRGRTTYCDRISSSSGLSVASLFPFHRGKIKSYTREEGGSYDVDLLKEERFFLFSCLFSCFKIMRGILRERDEIVIERKKMRGFIDT